MTVVHYTAAKMDIDDYRDTIGIKLSDSDRDKIIDIVTEIVENYHLTEVNIGRDERQPTFTAKYEQLGGQFRMFSGFNAKDTFITNGHLSSALYNYKNYVVVETRTFGGIECAKTAKMINNELYDRLIKEYGSTQVVKWSGFDCPKGFFDK
jgi:hypothetical protein